MTGTSPMKQGSDLPKTSDSLILHRWIVTAEKKGIGPSEQLVQSKESDLPADRSTLEQRAETSFYPDCLCCETLKGEPDLRKCTL